jgi:hypothetical protein
MKEEAAQAAADNAEEKAEEAEIKPKETEAAAE